MPRSTLALPVVLATTLLMTVNTAIVNVALASIRDELGFTAATLSWVVDGYLLSYGGCLIVGGRLGDILGRRRVLLAGLAVFTMASAGAGVADSAATLIAARILQGLGAALAAPAVLAIITHLFHGQARTKALGGFSLVIGAGLSLGMIAGGVILHWLDWRWIFRLDVPLGVALFALTALVVPTMPTEGSHRIDIPGALLATLAAASGVYALVEMAAGASSTGWAIAGLVVSVPATVCFARRLKSAANPLIPLALFARRTANGAFLANALQAAANTGLVFFLSQLFSDHLGLGPLGVGSLFLVFTAPQLVGALSASTLIQRLGLGVVVKSSLLASIAGMLLLAFSVPQAAVSALLLAGMALSGLGAGALFLGINITVMSAVDHRIAGAASGLLQTAIQLGASVGIAVLVLIDALAGSMSVFVACAVLLLGALLAMSLRDSNP